MVKDGDKVTGVPIPTDEHPPLPPTVTGTLEIGHGQFLDSTWRVFLVWVEDADGDRVPVECDEGTLRPADPNDPVTRLRG